MAQLPNQSRTSLPQNKEALLKSYQMRLRDDIKCMVDNFTEIIKLAKVEDETQISRLLQSNEDQYEATVRSANMVRAAESLLKLVTDIKLYLILNDFPSVNESITSNFKMCKMMQTENDSKLMIMRDDLAAGLYELEEEYYSSQCIG